MQRTWVPLNILIFNHHDNKTQKNLHDVFAHCENTSFEFSNSWHFAPNGNWDLKKREFTWIISDMKLIGM